MICKISCGGGTRTQTKRWPRPQTVIHKEQMSSLRHVQVCVVWVSPLRFSNTFINSIWYEELTYTKMWVFLQCSLAVEHPITQSAHEHFNATIRAVGRVLGIIVWLGCGRPQPGLMGQDRHWRLRLSDASIRTSGLMSVRYGSHQVAQSSTEFGGQLWSLWVTESSGRDSPHGARESLVISISWCWLVPWLLGSTVRFPPFSWKWGGRRRSRGRVCGGDS